MALALSCQRPRRPLTVNRATRVARLRLLGNVFGEYRIYPYIFFSHILPFVIDSPSSKDLEYFYGVPHVLPRTEHVYKYINGFWLCYKHHVIIYKFVTDVIIKFYFILTLNNKLIFNVNFFHYFFNQSKN